MLGRPGAPTLKPTAFRQMTGRKGRVVSNDDGSISYESRSELDVPVEILNITEKQRFMDGDKVTVLFDASSWPARRLAVPDSKKRVALRFVERGVLATQNVRWLPEKSWCIEPLWAPVLSRRAEAKLRSLVQLCSAVASGGNGRCCFVLILSSAIERRMPAGGRKTWPKMGGGFLQRSVVSCLRKENVASGGTSWSIQKLDSASEAKKVHLLSFTLPLVALLCLFQRILPSSPKLPARASRCRPTGEPRTRGDGCT